MRRILFITVSLYAIADALYWLEVKPRLRRTLGI